MVSKIIFLGLLVLIFLFSKTLDDAMDHPLFEKISTRRDGDSNEISELMQRVRTINIIRYSLRFVVILWFVYMLFGEPRLGLIILVALSIPISILDIYWRRLIRNGIKALS